MHKIQGIIADMDGVLWRGAMPIPQAAPFFASISVPYVFATNNSSRTLEYYVDKLNSMGIAAVADQVVTSAIATAEHLAARYPLGTRAFVVGQEGIKQALRERGFLLTDIPNYTPDVVVAGIDHTLTYDKLAQAAIHIRNGAHFVGTNGDKTYPTPKGLTPGAGSILAAIETATEVAPVVIGKPEAPMFEIALQKLGTPPEHTLMIGDRLETDIRGAQALGMKSALVLTGVSTETDIIKSGIQADFVVENLQELRI